MSDKMTNISFTALFSNSTSLSYKMVKENRIAAGDLKSVKQWNKVLSQSTWLTISLKVDTVSSLVNIPPPKKSCPDNALMDLSLSSRGGNPHVKTFQTRKMKLGFHNRISIKRHRIFLSI